MSKQPSDPMISLLADSLRSGASSDQIAESIAQACKRIDAALAPVCGRRGVAALIHRSLHLTMQPRAWDAQAIHGNESGLDIEAFSAMLARQPSADAAACGLLFLATFNDLLMNLIGSSLTERLLRSVWATSFDVTPPQGTTP